MLLRFPLIRSFLLLILNLNLFLFPFSFFSIRNFLRSAFYFCSFFSFFNRFSFLTFLFLYRFLFGGSLDNRLGVDISILDSQFHEFFHLIHVQIVLLSYQFGLSSLSSEGETYYGELKREVMRVLGFFNFCSLFVVQADYLLNCVSQVEVIFSFFRNLELSLFESHCICSWAFSFASFGSSRGSICSLHDLLEVRKVIRNDFFSPLTLVFKVITEFSAIKVNVVLRSFS